MTRFAALLVVVALAISGWAQMFSHGVPASVTSPGPDGTLHGVPASVVSPTRIPPGVHPPLAFGFQRAPRHFGGDRNRHKVFVPIPIFTPIYPTYVDGAYPIADPSVEPADPQSPAAGPDQNSRAAAESDQALQQAYLQGARDALKQQRDDMRYGEHYMDARERSQQSETEDPPAAHGRFAEPAAPAPAKEDPGPATVFIFKDGHQIETHNFAIMGQMLYDFSGSGLKKVELADLDKDKTLKANDDRGLIVKLP